FMDSYGTAGKGDLGTDLRIVFSVNGADLSGSEKGLEIVTGPENLRQALLLRLFTDQGELTGLGHPGYGSRLSACMPDGPLEERDRELLRRSVGRTLLCDERVAEVEEVLISLVPDQAKALSIQAAVRAVSGQELLLEVDIHA
ncbi:MAG: hypothetical protein D3909_19555, partial [Candidatus Electrothrix sp. ATG1]|nr:hypothetical protein [Candidatus Electrothrix sp. ATG1]